MNPLIALSLAGCMAVAPGSDKILGRDLIKAFPAIAAAAPDAEIAVAPAPGVSRVFRANDFRMLAARFHLEDAPLPEPFCAERPAALLNVKRLSDVMQASLPGALIEILEFSHQPAPEGDIEFPRTGLRGSGPNATGLWDGFVRYAGIRRFAIWAKVRVLVPVTQVRASVDLRPNQPIDAAQLTIETHQEFPPTGRLAQTADDVAGQWPRLPIRAGTAIRLDQLVRPKDVMRGEIVQVEVRSGAARVVFPAVAEGSGSTGETVLVLNTDSKKRFNARVEAKGRVSIDVAPKTIGEEK